jgi:hypothetical protein
MLMRMVRLAVFALAALFGSDAASASDAPLFDSMKKFCVATHAQPDAVKAAVETAGGTLKQPTATTAWPFPMTVTTWQLTVDTESQTISAGSIRASADAGEGGRQYRADSCTITTFSNDTASVDAIRTWVGVAPSWTSSGNTTVESFDFQEVDGVASPLPAGKAAYTRAVIRGLVWSMEVIRSAGQVSVQMTHRLPSALDQNTK